MTHIMPSEVVRCTTFIHCRFGHQS